MDAVAKMKDSAMDVYIWGHHSVCAILTYRDHVIPFGIRLYVKKEHSAALRLSFHKTTDLAAQVIHEFQAPAGIKVMVLFDTYYLCRTVVGVRRAQSFHFTSTLKINRRICKQG